MIWMVLMLVSLVVGLKVRAVFWLVVRVSSLAIGAGWFVVKMTEDGYYDFSGIKSIVVDAIRPIDLPPSLCDSKI
jgi:hypothetical protein